MVDEPKAAPSVRVRSSGQHGGTRFAGIPVNRDMRTARRKMPPLRVITKPDEDPCLDMLEVVLRHIEAGRAERPHQGRPLDTKTLLQVVGTLRAAGVPLRAWVDPDLSGQGRKYKPAAQHLIEQELGLTPNEAIGALRRLVDLRSQLPKEWLTY
jgi:hypothetical protein